MVFKAVSDFMKNKKKSKKRRRRPKRKKEGVGRPTLSKYDTWEEFRSCEKTRAILDIENGQAFAALKNKGVGKETLATSGKVARCLFENQTAFAEAKTKGVGRRTLAKFLGENWSACSTVKLEF